MEKEHASTASDSTASETVESHSVAPVKAVRARRASAKVSSPAKEAATKAGVVDAPVQETSVEKAPAKKAPARRSRAKKIQEPAAPSLLDGLTDTAEGADSSAQVPGVDGAAASASTARKSSGTRSRTGKTVAAAQSLEAFDVPQKEAVAADPSSSDAVAEKAPVKRPVRRRATAPVMAPKSVAVETANLSSPDTGSDSVDSTFASSTRTQSSGRKNSATAAVAAVQGELSLGENNVDSPVEPAKKAPVRRRATKKAGPADNPATTALNPTNSIPAVEAGVVGNGVNGVAEATAGSETSETVVADAVADAPTRSRRRATAKRTSAVGSSRTETSAQSQRSGDDVADGNVNAEVAPASEAPDPVETADGAGIAEENASALFLAPGAGVSALFLAPDLASAVAQASRDKEKNASDDSDQEDGHSEHDDARRGSRRGRNRRNKPVEAAAEHAEDDAQGESGDSDGVTSRRRRRRRRGEADLELTGGTEEDPPNTVTKVRAPRVPLESSSTVSNRVTSLRGSTRLEAKKQRRRDSRDSGRRRSVITEAEFLARRESVDRVMVVRQSEDRIQIGVLEDGILAEHFVSKTQQDSLIGNVYLGKVQNVLPSMEAAFVDIGRGRNAVLYAGEVDWDGAKLNGQPRRIENALKSGDSVLVQVSKDPVGHKGARLTSQISLPGRYLVYVPGGSMTGISRKLPDVERNRLKRVLKDHLPENAGVIVRTAAEGASEEELTNDINRLRAQWEGISTSATSQKSQAPQMLYGEPDLTIKVVRDVFNEDFNKLIVSGEEAWDTIEAYVTYVAPDLLDRLEKWTKPEDIFGAYRIDEQISKALERKVFLPSGGSLVIDRTEAMTVVDVNTGKFTGSGGNLEETVTKNNLEAAEEVVRQLRLRDIGGIIVIDFIDMVLESNRDLVLRRLVECLGRDRTKHQVAEVTSLGLIQMTRKRMGTGLLEVFGEQCEACAGRGMVTHEIPVEHRRVHTVATDSHQSHTPVKTEHRDGERTANRSTRSERKRNRNNRPQQQDGEFDEANDQSEPAAVVVDEATQAQRAAKASAARAALASIAAAAAAAHHGSEAPVAGGAPVSPAEAQTAPTQLLEAGVLTLGGEAVELPRGHHEDAPARNTDQAERLAGLAQALDQLAVSHDVERDSHDGTASGRSRPRRNRRNRSARSAQGGADTRVETSDGSGQSSSAGASSSAVVTHAVSSASVKMEPAKKAAEPIIMLGVGVPASEL
ncbi:Rne/Rng family ribonuclease [Arthrobacter cryoconiti]|uniref:Rne/Rng family ribonuclease n=1 Tax=Arthrobacter cryoconiti TaxID=748907 RepID=A0ABV8R1B2_9MICC|nr:Rne/Rng family ribonuclease [Arthrobacter cryoconiti]MCC9068532.1 Rne/Rng family ribonuclease [Arthrobacter cryoconiti]